MNDEGIEKFLSVAAIGKEIKLNTTRFSYRGTIIEINKEKNYLIVEEPWKYNLRSIINLSHIWTYSII